MAFDELDWEDDEVLPDTPEVRVSVAGMSAGQARLFPFRRAGQALTGLVVEHEGEWFVYVNRCPHVPYSLDIGDGRVKDRTGKFLICSSHGAMFLPESGECFMGPVVGRRLEPLAFVQEGDELVVTISAEPEGWPRGC